ncbi:hypothetical protein [Endozoicomonas lisbonensis]|uniref:Ig-like domain-containing protein n=1 Tax=Endozoicomonas lisbonensis TaxID=3120522 RepID=A0ABV2SNB7_9GAMM
MFVFRVCRPFLLLLFASPLFYSSAQAAGWLELPEHSVPPKSDSIDESFNCSVKGQQLIQWLGTASQHGISLPEQGWLQQFSEDLVLDKGDRHASVSQLNQ